jgi:hypothetical protein
MSDGEKLHWIALTLADTGLKIDVPAEKLQCIRPTVPLTEEPGTTRVEWVVTDFVMESVEEISKLAAPFIPGWASLTLPGGGPFCFDAAQSVGPYYVPRDARAKGRKADIFIAGGFQGLSNTPDEVAAAIRQGKGFVRPVIEDALWDTLTFPAQNRINAGRF